MKPTLLTLLALPLFLMIPACSSGDDDDASSTAHTIPSALSGYCTGTLLVDKSYTRPDPGIGGWSGRGQTMAAGTKMVLEYSFDGWSSGYAYDSSGVAKISGDMGANLVKGTDFSTDCANPASEFDSEFVILAKSTIYESEDLSGTPCTLEVGQSFKHYGYSSGGGSAASFQSDELKALCGFDSGYSKDLVSGDLMPK